MNKHKALINHLQVKHESHKAKFDKQDILVHIIDFKGLCYVYLDLALKKSFENEDLERQLAHTFRPSILKLLGSNSMKVPSYHTITPEDAPYGPVYHDDDECIYGKKIKPENKKPGDAGRKHCEECRRLSS